MVPFMAGQSLAMGEAFGKGFQYGKRKISSMSNEEFNALDFGKLSESIHTDYKVMIPSLIQSIQESKVLQDAVFKALGDVILNIPQNILDFFKEAAGSTTTSISASGLGSELKQIRLDLGQAERREGEGGQRQGSSLFEKDQLAKREKELARLIAEAEAKVKRDTTVKPTKEQQNTVLTPSFVSSLNITDLMRGGKRTRSTRQGLIQWTGTHMILKVGESITTHIWQSNRWKVQSTSKNVNNKIAKARSIANQVKARMGSSYVLEMNQNRWFLISDGHVSGF